ncbi:beta-alanyl-bioamine nonribosomal peptide synthetase ebony-like isoform X2 [Lineus longissimus]
MAENRLNGFITTVPDLLLHEVFEKVAAQSSEKPAIYDGDRIITFGELNSRANQFSRMVKDELSSYGISPAKSQEPVICLMMSPSVERIVAILAMFKLGAGYLPLEASLPINRIIHIVRESKPVCLISSSDNATIINNVEIISEGLKILEFEFLHQKSDSDIQACNLSENEKIGYKENPLACILYTSGSTGVPKGVRLRHRNAMNRLSWQWRVLPFGQNDVGCAKTSLMFVDSLTEIWGCLLEDTPIVIVQKAQIVNTELFIKILKKFNVSRLILVPSLLKKLILMITSGITPVEMVSKLQLIVSSGEVLPPQLAIDFFHVFPNHCHLANFYGTTEVTGDVTFDVFTSEDDVRQRTKNGCLSIGAVVDNCSVHLLDEHLDPVENRDSDGEIVISGLNVADGYMLGNQSSFVENILEQKPGHELLYKTGDYGTIVDGRVYYEGRKDSVVKIRGQRVSLMEVERVILMVEDVEKTVVLLRKANEQNQMIVGFALPKKGAKLYRAILTRHCRKELPGYMVPEIMVLEEFPLQPQTGKIDRQKLLELFEASLGSGAVSKESTGDPILDRSLGIVASVLGRPRHSIKATDNFFSIGGNSINAISVIVKLKEAGIHVDTGDFFAAETIKDAIAKRTESGMEHLTMPALNEKYSIEPLQAGDRDGAISVIANAFIRKDAMTIALGVPFQIFHQHLEKLFPAALDCGMSVVIREKESGRIVAANFFADMEKCPPEDGAFRFSDFMRPIGELLGSVDAPVQEHLKGRWLTGLLGGTNLDLSSQENVEMFYHMEMEVIRRATDAGFDGIEETNTHPVTVNLATYYLGYKTFLTYQINKFLLPDGRRPFAKIPDDSIIAVQLKFLSQPASQIELV